MKEDGNKNKTPLYSKCRIKIILHAAGNAAGKENKVKRSGVSL